MLIFSCLELNKKSLLYIGENSACVLPTKSPFSLALCWSLIPPTPQNKVTPPSSKKKKKSRKRLTQKKIPADHVTGVLRVTADNSARVEVTELAVTSSKKGMGSWGWGGGDESANEEHFSRRRKTEECRREPPNLLR